MFKGSFFRIITQSIKLLLYTALCKSQSCSVYRTQYIIIYCAVARAQWRTKKRESHRLQFGAVRHADLRVRMCLCGVLESVYVRDIVCMTGSVLCVDVCVFCDV